MGIFVVSVSFRLEISLISERKMPQSDPELSKKVDVLSFLMQFLYFSGRFHSKFQHQQLKNERTSFALHLLKRT